MVFVAALYGMTLAMTMATPRGEPMWGRLDEVRNTARVWCGVMVLLTGAVTYACGRVSFLWRKRVLAVVHRQAR